MRVVLCENLTKMTIFITVQHIFGFVLQTTIFQRSKLKFLLGHKCTPKRNWSHWLQNGYNEQKHCEEGKYIATRNDGIALTREAMGTELNLKPLSSLVLKRLGEYHKL